MDDLQRHDAADRRPAAAGDRRGAGRGVGGRLPAGRELRSRRRLDQGGLRHARRRYRAVLLDADGGAVAQRGAQARDGDAAHRRDRRRPRRPPPSASSTRGAGGPRRRAGGDRLAHAGSRRSRRTSLKHRQGRRSTARVEMPLAEAYALRLRGDDREHDGARRRGRHLRLHRKARADAGRSSSALRSADRLGPVRLTTPHA